MEVKRGRHDRTDPGPRASTRRRGVVNTQIALRHLLHPGAHEAMLSPRYAVLL